MAGASQPVLACVTSEVRLATDQYPCGKLEDPKTHIRILSLLPSTGGRLECTIQQVSVFNAKYHALSYVWGAADKYSNFRIIVRHTTGTMMGSIPLTANLNNALQNLRDLKEMNGKELWIDQICINQDPIGAEKNHQVMLMDQIYTRAQKVITYLGPVSAPKSVEEQRIGLLEQLYNHFKSNLRLLFEWREFRDLHTRRSELPVQELPDVIKEMEQPKEFWQWLVEVVFGEWSRRLWMVQEQVLNNANVMLRGSRLLPWDAIVTMALLFHLEFLPKEYVVEYWLKSCQRSHATHTDIFFAMFELWYKRRRRHTVPSANATTSTFQDRNNILANMYQFANHECCDPRDRVFALLAISTGGLDLGISTDYNKCPAKSRNLAVISYACYFDNSIAGPSWALNCPRSVNQLAQREPPERYSPHPKQTISRVSDTWLTIKDNNATLLLRGCFADRISLATQPYYLSEGSVVNIPDGSSIRARVEHLSSMLIMLQTPKIDLKNLEALSRAMAPSFKLPTGSKLERLHLSTSIAAFSLWCYLRKQAIYVMERSAGIGIDVDDLVSKANHCINTLEPLVLEPGQFQLSSLQNHLNDLEEEAATLMFEERLIRGRSLCRTKDQRICNAMHEVQKGDEIAILEGADILYILRPVDTRYRLIGAAYVDGLMKGEIYQGRDPHEVDRNIELI